MSMIIRDNPAAELERLSATNFFRDKPVGQSKSAYLYYAAKREAARWGVQDDLANHYIRLAGHARVMGL